MYNRNQSLFMLSSLVPIMVKKPKLKEDPENKKNGTLAEHQRLYNQDTKVYNEILSYNEIVSGGNRTTYNPEIPEKSCGEAIVSLFTKGDCWKQQDLVEGLGLPDWIDISKLSPRIQTLWMKNIVDIVHNVASFSLFEFNKQIISERCTTNFGNTILYEMSSWGTTQASAQHLRNTLDFTISSIQVLTDNINWDAVHMNFLCEFAHLTLNLLYNLYNKPGIRTDLTNAMRDGWVTTIQTLQGTIETTENVPMNTVIYELDMLERGINLLKTRGFKGSQLLSSGIGSSIRLLATGDPTALLSTIKDGLGLGTKVLIRKYRGEVFKTAYWIDQFKLWIILQKVKVGDILIREHFQLEAPKGEFSGRYNHIDLLEDMKDA
jgi:hypothetical protein